MTSCTLCCGRQVLFQVYCDTCIILLCIHQNRTTAHTILSSSVVGFPRINLLNTNPIRYCPPPGCVRAVGSCSGISSSLGKRGDWIWRKLTKPWLISWRTRMRTRQAGFFQIMRGCERLRSCFRPTTHAHCWAEVDKLQFVNVLYIVLAIYQHNI